MGCLLIAITALAMSGPADGDRATLQEVQERLDSLEIAHEQLHAREAGLGQQLLSAEGAVNACRRQLDVLAGLRAEREAELHSVTDSLARLEAQTQLGRARLGRAFRNSYLLSTVPPIGVLLNAETFGQAARRGHCLWLAAARQRKRLAAALDLARRLVNARAEVEVHLQRLTELHQEEQDRLIQFSGYREERERLLRAVRTQEEEYAFLIEELRTRRNQLREIIDSLVPVDGAVELTELKGQLVWPVRGTIIAGYGMQRDRRYWTNTFNPGVDIEAREGDSVGSVAPGVVVYSGWHDGLGNLVIVDHGSGYYTMYGHLLRPRVAVGQRVTTGQRIGDVGDTLSLRGPCLHFQIRHQRRSLDPFEWLEATD